MQLFDLTLQKPVPVKRTANQNQGTLGSAGVPNWIQNPAIPRCPKTGAVMRFVCQLNSTGSVGARRHNLDLTNEPESTRHYYTEMNFWCDGNLFVFLHPESRMAAYLLQNT